MSAADTSAVPPAEACTDAVFDTSGTATGPGCGCIEYDLRPSPPLPPRLHFDADLFLRSMPYLGTYSSAAYAFAPFRLCVELDPSPATLAAIPPPVLDAAAAWISLPDAAIRVEVAVSAPPPRLDHINIVTHPWVFDPAGPPESNFTYRGGVRKTPPKPKARRKRHLIGLGVLEPDGVTPRLSRRPVAFGALGPIEVSMHAKKRAMACSPNNAQLAVDPDSPAAARGWVSFWSAAVLADRLRLTFHIVVTDPALDDALLSTIVAANDPPTPTLPDLLDALAAAAPPLVALVDAITPLLVPPSPDILDAYDAASAARAAAAAATPLLDPTEQWLAVGEAGMPPKDAKNAAGAVRSGRGPKRPAGAATSTCMLCAQSKPNSSFSKSQRRRPDDARKCMTCIAAAQH